MLLLLILTLARYSFFFSFSLNFQKSYVLIHMVIGFDSNVKADIVNRGYDGYNTRWALFLLHHLFPLVI